MNTVCLVGRLTRDPELRTTQGGTEMCSLRIAVDRAGPKMADDTISAGFFDVTYWGKTAENVARFFHKGKQIAVTGSLKWREWEDKDTGAKRQAVDVNGFSFTFVGSKNDNEDGSSNTAYTPAAAPADDDIPF